MMNELCLAVLGTAPKPALHGDDASSRPEAWVLAVRPYSSGASDSFGGELCQE
jgi:hypothetical protein